MNDLDVIEIPSSPEPEARRLRSRPRRKQVPAPPEDVIELSDSDDGVGSSSRKQRPRRRPVEVSAGPSGADEQTNITHKKAPRAKALSVNDGIQDSAPGKEERIGLFIPDTDDEKDLQVAGPSMKAAVAPPLPALELEAAASLPPSKPGALLENVAVEADDFDGFVAQVLEIIPNVLPEHARKLIEQHYPSRKGQVVETVLHLLFEDPSYPKSDPKGKRKLSEMAGSVNDEQRNTKVKLDFGCKDRESEGGPNYVNSAMQQLYADFPRIPVAHVRGRFFANNSLYAPTYLLLHEEAKIQPLPYKLKPETRHGKGKGVLRHDAELVKEMEWVQLRLQEEPSAQAADQGEEDEENSIECGCCFSIYPFEKMIQCPEAHLFCTDCIISYASTLLGSHDARIACMDQSGCKELFPESELRRVLPPKLIGLYDRVRQLRDIEAAGLENLEECPFCEYKCVIDNPEEKLFRCENADCMAVTCRECKKADHLPRSCKEVEEDKKLDVRHAIEEAMTRALMRNCPKCSKAFIKEQGCNKMTCPNCATMSCYICRKVVTGYNHFGNPPPNTGQANPKKCQLWDPVEQRHSEEVTAAAKKAVEEFKRSHPELAEEDLHVDLPPPAVAGPSDAARPVAVAGAPPNVVRNPIAAAAHYGRQLANVFLGDPLQAPPVGGAVYNLHVNFNAPQVYPGIPAIGMPAVGVGPVVPPPIPQPPRPARPAARAPRRARARRKA